MVMRAGITSSTVSAAHKEANLMTILTLLSVSAPQMSWFYQSLIGTVAILCILLKHLLLRAFYIRYFKRLCDIGGFLTS